MTPSFPKTGTAVLAEILVFFDRKSLSWERIESEENLKSGDETKPGVSSHLRQPRNEEKKYALVPSQLVEHHPIFECLRSNDVEIMSDQTKFQANAKYGLCMILTPVKPYHREEGKVALYVNQFGSEEDFRKLLPLSEQWSSEEIIGIRELQTYCSRRNILSAMDEKGLAVVEEFLILGISVVYKPYNSYSTPSGDSFLSFAITLHHNLLSERLIKKGVSAAEIEEAFSAVLDTVNVDMAELLLKHGVGMEKTRALHYTVDENNWPMTEFLLNHGAQVNAKLPTDKKETALHFSTRRQYLEIMSVLLGSGADVNATDNDLKTPLHYAMEKLNCQESIDILLRFGAHCIFEDFLRLASNMSYDSFPFELDFYETFQVPLNISFSDVNVTRTSEVQEYIDKLLHPTVDLFDVFRNNSEEKLPAYMTFLKMFACQIIKIEVAYGSVGPKIPRRAYEYFQLDVFKNDCIQEIQNLKSDFVVEEVSLFEIMTQSTSGILKNNIVYKNLKTFTAETYSIYGDILKSKITEGFRRKRVSKVASKILEFLFPQFTDLPWFLQDKIVKYINNQDILILTNAFSWEQLDALTEFFNCWMVS
nr:PREDICTED: uncharacterized protein LOC109037488 [Bemisia tabaci]